MKLRTRDVWAYAFLLILLFAIAAVAARAVIDYLQENVPIEQYRIVTTLISSLSLGLMLIAGAFGLWAIQFGVGAETRRQVGQLVDGMDYLPDGLLAVDNKGIVRGANPTALRLAGVERGRNLPLRQWFGCLEDDDVRHFTQEDEAYEVERSETDHEPIRTFRFRSLPSDGLVLILVSDVTSTEARRILNRQAARLQLIGQITRGIAHDFNSLLCAISGHASLIGRLPAGSNDSAASLADIIRHADRGVALSGQLLQLSRPPLATARWTAAAAEHARAAAALLQDSLPESWHVRISTADISGVALTGIEIEQAVTNLGILIAGTQSSPATISITAVPPDPAKPLFAVGTRYAGVILIEGTADDRLASATLPDAGIEDAGAVQSVVQSMLVAAGGRLDCLRAGDGSTVYRLCLPRASVAPGNSEDAAQLGLDLGPYVSRWRVIILAAEPDLRPLARRLGDMKAQVERVTSPMAALSRMEDASPIDVMLIDAHLLGPDVKGLLRAILKLRPDAGVTLLADRPEQACEGLPGDVVVIARSSSAEAAITAMIDARGRASRRKR